MDDGEILSLFSVLYEDIKKEDFFPNHRPLLAHYTSIEAMENILKTDELLFSNPLFMNDIEEVIFGFRYGLTKIKDSDAIKGALKTEERYIELTRVLDWYVSEFEEKHLLDTYVFCLSEHESHNSDGVLSMWRGYGGNGKGAALVFDTTKVDPVDDSPIWILRVHYGSLDERFEWLDNIAAVFVKILVENEIPDDKIYLAGQSLFERIKVFALSTKHDGFKEEKEWRAVYMSDRDYEGKLKPMQHYRNGPRGVEPKLRFKLAPMEGITGVEFLPANILANILLGPSTSYALTFRSVERMLDLIGKAELKERLIASTIPLRAT